MEAANQPCGPVATSTRVRYYFDGRYPTWLGRLVDTGMVSLIRVGNLPICDIPTSVPQEEYGDTQTVRIACIDDQDFFREQLSSTLSRIECSISGGLRLELKTFETPEAYEKFAISEIWRADVILLDLFNANRVNALTPSLNILSNISGFRPGQIILLTNFPRSAERFGFAYTSKHELIRSPLFLFDKINSALQSEVPPRKIEYLSLDVMELLGLDSNATEAWYPLQAGARLVCTRGKCFLKDHDHFVVGNGGCFVEQYQSFFSRFHETCRTFFETTGSAISAGWRKSMDAMRQIVDIAALRGLHRARDDSQHKNLNRLIYSNTIIVPNDIGEVLEVNDHSIRIRWHGGLDALTEVTVRRDTAPAELNLASAGMWFSCETLRSDDAERVVKQIFTAKRIRKPPSPTERKQFWSSLEAADEV